MKIRNVYISGLLLCAAATMFGGEAGESKLRAGSEAPAIRGDGLDEMERFSALAKVLKGLYAADAARRAEANLAVLDKNIARFKENIAELEKQVEVSDAEVAAAEKGVRDAQANLTKLCREQRQRACKGAVIGGVLAVVVSYVCTTYFTCPAFSYCPYS